MTAMGQGFDMAYHPDEKKAGVYNRRYERYRMTGGFTEQIKIQLP